jgi:poly(3-hydroxybutyrate) depolymerase
VRRLVLLALLLLACGPKHAPLGPAVCPTMAPGEVSLVAAGEERSVLLLSPPKPKPALPVVFVWHGLGATAASMIPRLRLAELATEALVVVPKASPKAKLGWGYGPDGREDLALFDSVLACLVEQHRVDEDRVSSVGFSAGGFWTTWLLMNRTDRLASAAPLSGGVWPPVLPYRKPSWPIPVLAMDGGERDIYRSRVGPVHFDRNTDRLRDALGADGHAVVHCRGRQGHRIPTPRSPALHRWVLGARRGSADAPAPTPAGCTGP